MLPPLASDTLLQALLATYRQAKSVYCATVKDVINVYREFFFFFPFFFPVLLYASYYRNEELKFLD